VKALGHVYAETLQSLELLRALYTFCDDLEV
jgi:hypothetical protein